MKEKIGIGIVLLVIAAVSCSTHQALPEQLPPQLVDSRSSINLTGKIVTTYHFYAVREEMELLKAQLFRQYLDEGARGRLQRIKLANPDNAARIEALIVQLIQSGQIRGKLGEEAFVKLLKQVMGQKRDFKITRR